MATKSSVDMSSTEVTNKSATNIAYADATTVEDLQPAEAGAEVNPPTLTNPDLTVVDNSATGDDDYTCTWDYSNAVTASFTVDIEYFRNGVSQGSNTNVTATNGSDSFSDASGDGSVDNHHAVIEFFDPDGAKLDELTTPTVASNVI